MAEVKIPMPKMGDGMEEGTINSWLIKEGGQVKAGDAIAEIETDKANVEIATYETGILTKIIVQVGQTVPVGEAIAVINVVGAAIDETAEAERREREKAEAERRERERKEQEEAKRREREKKEKNGTGNNGRRIPSSPVARKIAKEKGYELTLITGSGPNGRIVMGDVLAYEPPIVEDENTEEDIGSLLPTYQDIATSIMRQAIARRTVQSKQNTPHFYVTMLIEMDRALALLKELNVDAAKDEKVTVNDIIVKACARSLAKVPEVNATWTPKNTIRRYAHAHIGIAVGIDDGLIIPVVRDCHRKTLREISVEAKQLITRARNNQLKPEEYQGSTFSVSNLGMMGVDEFIAIINPPEAAILAIGGIAREPVVVGDTDEIVIRSRMKVTISADHRLLDGVVAARFLQEVKKALEAPFSLLS